MLLQLVGFARRIQDSMWGGYESKISSHKRGRVSLPEGRGVAASVHDNFFLVDDKSKRDTAVTAQDGMLAG